MYLLLPQDPPLGPADADFKICQLLFRVKVRQWRNHNFATSIFTHWHCIVNLICTDLNAAPQRLHTSDGRTSDTRCLPGRSPSDFSHLKTGNIFTRILITLRKVPQEPCLLVLFLNLLKMVCSWSGSKQLIPKCPERLQNGAKVWPIHSLNQRAPSKGHVMNWLISHWYDNS